MIASRTTKIRIADVRIPEHFLKTFPATKKIADRLEFYRKNRCFDRDLIVDESNNLVDGYTVYLACKTLGIEKIRGLRLKVVNVIRPCNESETPDFLKDRLNEICLNGETKIGPAGAGHMYNAYIATSAMCECAKEIERLFIYGGDVT